MCGRKSRKLLSLIASNTAGGLIFPLVTLVFGRETTLAELWVQFKISCVYSYSIGTLAFLVSDRAHDWLVKARPGLRYTALLAGLVTVAVIGALFANVVFVAIGWEPVEVFWKALRSGLRIALAITLGFGVVMTVYETLMHQLRAATLELRTHQLEEERARKLATEAQLSSLESRIHPHFLFNTLNSISALIREDPARAERTVERLAALLRYSLDVNAHGLVPLRQELRIVEDYLEIEKTRFGERLRYSVNIPEQLHDLEVPPLALQTLVENSIKHAVAINRQGGEISVTTRLDAERLVLEVSDDGPGFDLRALKAGHGLVNLQDRLAALFGGSGRLEIARRVGRMAVSVSVPQKAVLP